MILFILHISFTSYYDNMAVDVLFHKRQQTDYYNYYYYTQKKKRREGNKRKEEEEESESSSLSFSPNYCASSRNRQQNASTIESKQNVQSHLSWIRQTSPRP